jgi:hypothetical protein
MRQVYSRELAASIASKAMRLAGSGAAFAPEPASREAKAPPELYEILSKDPALGPGSFKFKATVYRTQYAIISREKTS